ncbi:hypothetical protein [Methylobacterium sp. CCH5-D2]|uniref:hypothetical protein n=1 Tax=Methylobacterium sp. CCH5-D2 TaxID=1768765 RepID=UPI000831B14D|nr:hypothetical protein [Methylobacterium sp. CCH5-D2]
MIVSRRAFLGLLAAASAARIAIPAFTPPRQPYVRVGQTVSYVGLARHPAPRFVGALPVLAVGAWDTVGYPVTLDDTGFCRERRVVHFYDVDLSDLLTEVPRDFWHHEANWARYPNVHAYVREQRYGEDPSVMRRRLAEVCGWYEDGIRAVGTA